MRILLAITVMLLFCLGAQAVSADELVLKNTLPGHWKFSVNGSPFQSLGPHCEGLCEALEGNPRAVQEVRKYNSLRTYSKNFFSLGIGAVAFSGIYRVFKKEWTDVSTYTALSGAVVLIAATSVEVIATGHLKRAVRLHNNDQTNLSLNLGVRQGLDGSPRYGLVLSF